MSPNAKTDETMRPGRDFFHPRSLHQKLAMIANFNIQKPVQLLYYDQTHLTAAEGYVELGMWLDANAELKHIDPEVRASPPVAEVRLRIYRGLEKWELMQTVAPMLVLDGTKNSRWTED